VPVADFDLVVTESGISVRSWNDDAWNKLVEEELKKIHNAQNQAGGFSLNDRFSEWYEANIKDKPFVFDEDMLKKMGELGMDVLTGDNADLARLIELRKDYYAGRLSMQFLFDLKLNTLTDKVKREKP
jgi:hypothetical protein